MELIQAYENKLKEKYILIYDGKTWRYKSELKNKNELCTMYNNKLQIRKYMSSNPLALAA